MDCGLGAAIDRLAAIDPSALTDDELHDLVILLVREASRFEAACAGLVSVWDIRKRWADNGAKAPTARLMSEALVSGATASEVLHRARRLRTMPHTAAALAEGKLSMDHADLLVQANQPDVADLFARDEGMLVDQIKMLRHPAARRCMRYWRNLAEDEIGREPTDRDSAGRHFAAVRTFRGNVIYDGMHDPVNGTIVLNELARLEKALFEQDWAQLRTERGEKATAAELPRTAAQRRADALVEMARRSAVVDSHAIPARPLFTVLVGYRAFSKTCELADGTVVSPGQLVPHLAEADVERIVFGGPSRVIDVGVRQRFFTGAVRRAIQVRDRHCTHPSGCDVPAEQCDIDHITPYSRGGLTTQDNGRCRCRVHNLQRNNHPEAPDDG